MKVLSSVALFLFHFSASISAKEIEFKIIDIGNQPDRQRYQKFYESTKMEFVKNPQLPFENAANIDMFILSAKLSNAYKANPVFGDLGDPRDEVAMRHNGIGFLAYDSNGVEIGRLSTSFWSCTVEKADMPVLDNSSKISFFNRAVVAYTTSKDNWEEGYWTDNTLVKRITPEEYKKAWRNVQDFAHRHPYLNGIEIWSKQHGLLSTSISCNAFIQRIVWTTAGRDVYKEALRPIGTVVVVFDADPKKVATEERIIEPVNFWTARFYDEHGTLNNADGSPHVYTGVPTRFYVRRNYMGEKDLVPTFFERLIKPKFAQKA